MERERLCHIGACSDVISARRTCLLDIRVSQFYDTTPSMCEMSRRSLGLPSEEKRKCAKGGAEAGVQGIEIDMESLSSNCQPAFLYFLSAGSKSPA